MNISRTSGLDSMVVKIIQAVLTEAGKDSTKAESLLDQGKKVLLDASGNEMGRITDGVNALKAWAKNQ